MTRVSDQHKVYRSYFVEGVHGSGTGIKISGSTWAPGYTPAHKETEKEAVEYAYNKLSEEILELNRLRSSLRELLVKLDEVPLDPKGSKRFTKEEWTYNVDNARDSFYEALKEMGKAHEIHTLDIGMTIIDENIIEISWEPKSV